MTIELRDLLARGYFPKELPPPFSTELFADAVTRATTGLPGHLALAGTIKNPGRSFPTAKLVRYSHARGGLLRRQLAIPNPIHHFLLCFELSQSWQSISAALKGGELASTDPQFSKQGRAIQGKHSLADMPGLALRSRANRRYLLRTDVSRFYHSIYTHSIPWALLGKPVAKSCRGFSELANRLDYWVRMAQDGQTVGIPIGPDTSLAFAELLMQCCDQILASDLPGLQGFRYIDDYHLSFRSRAEAENSYHLIERALGRFELALNPKKTEIVPLPTVLEKPWAGQLRRFRFSDKPSQQRSDLFEYFDLVFRLWEENRDEHVLNYALGRLRLFDLVDSNWPEFQRFLLLCASPEPSSLPFALEILVEKVNSGLELDRDRIQELLNTTVVGHGELPHSSEVAWSIWGSIALNSTLDSEAAKAVSGSSDSIVALLALHAEDEGLLSSSLDKSNWEQQLTEEGLYGDQWLLAYEAAIQGWLQPPGGSDHIAADPAFAFLRSQAVSFYSRGRAIAPTVDDPIPSAKPEPFDAILPGFY